MNNKKGRTIGFPHPPQSHGGPGSFQLGLQKALAERGWRIVYPEDGITPDVILVVGGTRKLRWLWKQKQKGTPIIQRLAGLNWMQKGCRFGVKAHFFSVVNNWIVRSIRKYLACAVVYQSKFVSDWWGRVEPTRAMECVIMNGVDIDVFRPTSEKGDRKRSLICVEGYLDYSPYTVDLINFADDYLRKNCGNFDRTKVYGEFYQQEQRCALAKEVEFHGLLSRNKVRKAYADGVFLSLDVNAACPNTVIEALACGLPVVGYDTGALRELVPEEAGSIVPYSGNPWALEFPDFMPIGVGAANILNNWDTFSKGARQMAESKFKIENILDQYISLVETLIK